MDVKHQLCGNRKADQRLCFRYTDSTIPLLSTSKIFHPLAIFYACTGRFVSDLFGNHIVGFLMTQLKSIYFLFTGTQKDSNSIYTLRLTNRIMVKCNSRMICLRFPSFLAAISCLFDFCRVWGNYQQTKCNKGTIWS